MNDITPKEASEILSHYTNLGYGIVIEGDDVSKIIQALSLASKTLANGTPYNPTDDCISREALKEDIDNLRLFKKWIREEIKTHIDNAPTVQPKYSLLPLECTDMEDAFNRGYRAGKIEGILKANKRPQGEWKFTTHHARRYRVCPLCSAEKLDDLSAGWNFCWHCGADMKGGAE